MTFDSWRGVAVLYGGLNASAQDSDEVWEYDGVAWTERDQGELRPGVRSDLRICFDSARGKTLVYGGWPGWPPPEPTIWEWDGEQWASHPVGEYGGWGLPFVFDSARGVALYGLAINTWQWNGLSLDLVDSGAPDNKWMAAAFDEARQKVVVFGGRDLGNSTWEWAPGQTWTRVIDESIPVPAVDVIYDATHQQLVTVDGYGRTWVRDTQDWRVTARTAPFGLHYTSSRLTYHAEAARPFLHVNGNSYVWDGENWAELPGSIVPRSQFAMAYDARRSVLVLFGGTSRVEGQRLYPTSVQQWNGSVWQEIMPPSGPVGRVGASLVYDSKREAVVLIGGSAEDGTCLSDVWSWNGVDWTPLPSLPAEVGCRFEAAATYDEGLAAIVISGGRTAGNVIAGDTWAWIADEWTQLSTDFGPGARYRSSLAYDRSANRLLLVGGTGPAAFGAADVWRLEAEPTPPIAEAGPPRVVEATGQAGALVILDGSGSSDPSGGSLSYSWSGPFPEGNGLAQGSSATVTLPLGLSTVTLLVTNVDGATATDTVGITVEDTTGPVLSLPQGITEEATGPTGASVTFKASAVDVVSGEAVPACSPSSGSVFPLGATTVVCNATDARGNYSHASFSIAVRDTIAPSISIIAPAETAVPLGKALTASYTCSDSGSGLASCQGTVPSGTPVDTASPGLKTFRVSARDQAGNEHARVVSYTVAYDVAILHDQQVARKCGSTYPVKIALRDATGANISSAAVQVFAVGISRISDTALGPVDDSGNANPEGNFRFTGDAYIFNMSTAGLGTGTYLLHFQCGSDPTLHSVQFQVK